MFDKWLRHEGIDKIVFTFPNKETITVENPMWLRVDSITNIRNYITTDGRDIGVNTGWLMLEYFGKDCPALINGKPNVVCCTVLEDE